MSTDTPETSRPELKSDEDWKAQVRAENAALDQQLRGESPHSPEATANEAVPLPKPDFGVLVGMFSTQAMVALGLLPNPANGQTKAQLDLARYFIDLLSVLEEKTMGNLTESERRLLDDTLHQLRMAYVEQRKA